MPDRLSHRKFRHVHRIYLEKDAVFRIDAELMMRTMQFISQCSRLDVERTRVLTEMMRSDFRAVSALMETFTGAQKRHDAMMNAGSRLLSGELLDAFAHVMRFVRGVDTTRNRYAHFVVGFAPDLEKALILIEPEHLYASNANSAAFEVECLQPLNAALKRAGENKMDASEFRRIVEEHNKRAKELSKNPATSLELDRDRAFVIRLDDVMNALRDSMKAINALEQLRYLLGDPDGPLGELGRAQLLRVLPDVPLQPPPSKRKPPEPPPESGERTDQSQL